MRIKTRYRISFILSLFLIFGVVNSQNKNRIDSLKNLLNNSLNDTAKIEWYLEISREYENTETALAYNYADSALKASVRIRYNEGMVRSYTAMSALNWMKGNYLEALDFCNKNLELLKSIGDKERIPKIFGHMGLIYSEIGNYSKSLEYYFQSLKANEEEKDTLGICIQLNNIGIVYADQGDNKKALENYHRSLKMAEFRNDKKRMATSYLNMGVAYKNIADITNNRSDLIQAAEYYEKALEINEEVGDKRRIASCLNNLGNVYSAMKDNDKALIYYKRVLTVREALDDPQGIAICLINIGSLNKDIGNYKPALQFLEKGEKVALEIGALELIKSVYIEYSQVYSLLKNYKKAYDYHLLYVQYNDSLYNSESSKQIAEMQTKYESEKKQKEIELLNKEKMLQEVEIEKKEAEVRKQNTQKIAFGAGFGLVLLLALVIFKGYKQKEKTNLLLEKQKQQIEIKNSHLETANTEISKQKNEIEEKNHEILASIRYAQRIQQAILPPPKLVKQHLKQSFILYKPKDIVAGDFYWMYSPDVASCADQSVMPERNRKTMTEENQKAVAEVLGATVLFAACDCTGHGVPGAFVSIVGHNALNRAVKEFGLSRPSAILDKVNDLVQETFSKSENEMKDGMDIALCSLEFPLPLKADGRVILQYSGANNSMYYLSNGELKEIKADKQPIGNFIAKKPFTNHEIILQKGDAVYVFSDGYADQFGGPKGKKFKYSQFEKLLVSIQDKSMDDQKEILDSEIEKWRGDLEQIDDICIIGIRI